MEVSASFGFDTRGLESFSLQSPETRFVAVFGAVLRNVSLHQLFRPHLCAVSNHLQVNEHVGKRKCCS